MHPLIDDSKTPFLFKLLLASSLIGGCNSYNDDDSSLMPSLFSPRIIGGVMVSSTLYQYYLQFFFFILHPNLKMNYIIQAPLG